jgi:uncharacterized protein (DUF58 family)
MPLFTEHDLARLRRLRMAPARVRRAAVYGERPSRTLGEGFEFGEHRAYTHGDDLRRVDWNVYGRLGQLFVKLFEAPGQLRVLLIADNAPTMDFGAADKWLAARRALGALGLIALTGSERVTLATVSDARPRVFNVAQEEQLLAALEGMVVVAAEPAERPLRELAAAQGRDAVVVVVGDFQRPGPGIAALRDARRNGARGLALWLSAVEERSPEVTGLARLMPVGEAGLRLRVDERALAAYRQEYQRWHNRTARALHAAGAVIVELDSGQTLSPLLRELARGGLFRSMR